MEEELELNPHWSRRRQNRAAAFRFLFQWELNRPEDLRSELDEFLARIGETRESFAYATELVDGVTTNLETLDERIGALAKNWEFSRIAKTDLALLRLAAFAELSFCSTVWADAGCGATPTAASRATAVLKTTRL